MPMRRGLRRESCNFCFRRKVRCDLASREKRGHNTCSQCDLRQMPCTLDSDDVRVLRRRRESSSIHSQAREASGHLVYTQNTNSPSTRPDYQLPPINDSPQVSTVELIGQDLPFYDMNLGQDFQLNSESIAFLDTIFAQQDELPDMPDLLPESAGRQPSEDGSSDNVYCRNVPDVDTITLAAALEAYFEMAAMALPILYRDAFMSDYRAERSSPSLVFAIACRGLPFSSELGNRQLQQRMAQLFRKNFLEAKQASGKEKTIRLDDLEALALMVNYNYDDDASDSESQLASLFLTHDFLVHMTLHYRLETWASSASTPLSRAGERKALLFWHVYGIDAFQCLQHKTPSQIREDDFDASEKIPGHDNKGYLDTVLSLAIVARQITHTLCTPLSKRKGIEASDIKRMYEALQDWRATSLPQHLQLDDNHGKTRPHSVPLGGPIQEESQHASALHRIVITLLEHECYMEIESYVAAYGIREGTLLEDVAADARVNYETLNTATKVAGLASWITSEHYDRGGQSFALADLAPGIVRDICAGTCFWLAEHAKNSMSKQMNTAGSSDSRSRSNWDSGEGRSQNYRRACMQLCEVVSSARYSQDTPAVIVRLEEQIQSLERVVKG